MPSVMCNFKAVPSGHGAVNITKRFTRSHYESSAPEPSPRLRNVRQRARVRLHTTYDTHTFTRRYRDFTPSVLFPDARKQQNNRRT